MSTEAAKAAPQGGLPRPHRHQEIVDVHLMLFRRAPGPEVLLARRAGTGYADGLLNLPSGHLEEGEDVRAAVLREAAEEIGLVLAPEQVAAALVIQHKPPVGRPRMGWFFAAELPPGARPVNAEPDKCAGIGWYPLDDLPDDTVAYCRAGLEAHRAGQRFVLHWHGPEDSIASGPQVPSRAVVLPQTDGPP
ncbi:NUDIX hydrolase [Streptomyces synnematoformans]|uniref:Nudix hydrolase domain-containing protein n=1 Tax=Streptomyces synnematoformans TaxID=415721 RepID=A0ABN1ZRI4_9ACTN